jgi:hypothetical protein
VHCLYASRAYCYRNTNGVTLWLNNHELLVPTSIMRQLGLAFLQAPKTSGRVIWPIGNWSAMLINSVVSSSWLSYTLVS